MKYKEALLLIGERLSSGEVDWEMFVWVSSNQMIVPTIYLQYKWADLLKELPDDLVEHLEDIYQQNYNRNKAILEQTHRLIKLLNKHNYYPIFLKGVGNLLDNLYDDLGERMIGDIDFLLAEDKVVAAAEMLMDDGYVPMFQYSQKLDSKGKHYPRLINSEEIAAVEVHFRPVKIPFDKNFGYDLISEEKKKLNIDSYAYVLSDNHRIIYSLMLVQMSDIPNYTSKITLRQIYDLFLVSNRKEVLATIEKYGYYFNKLNNYLALYSYLLKEPLSLKFIDNNSSRLFMKKYIFDITYVRLLTFRLKTLSIIRLFYAYLRLIIQSFYIKRVRVLVFSRILDPQWYAKKLGIANYQ